MAHSGGGPPGGTWLGGGLHLCRQIGTGETGGTGQHHTRNGCLCSVKHNARKHPELHTVKHNARKNETKFAHSQAQLCTSFKQHSRQVIAFSQVLCGKWQPHSCSCMSFVPATLPKAGAIRVGPGLRGRRRKAFWAPWGQLPWQSVQWASSMIPSQTCYSKACGIGGS